MTDGQFTIFKHAYWYGDKVSQLFVNHNYDGKRTLSFMIMDGKSYKRIHNIYTEDKMKLLKSILNSLNAEEKAELKDFV